MDNKEVTKQRRHGLKIKAKKRSLVRTGEQAPKRHKSGLQSGHDFDSQSGDADLSARDVLTQISHVKDQKNLSNRVKSHVKHKHVKRDFHVAAKRCHQNNHAPYKQSSAGNFEQTPMNSVDLWKLRAHHVQRIFSLPHKENCPLYSYSRCKKLGVDFNLGSGVKQNMDLNLLTNGVMVEVYNFAIALQSAQKYFISDILEYNFRLNFKNELCRSAFAHKTVLKISDMNSSGNSTIRRLQMPFELPDYRSSKGSNRAEIYCHKCFKDEGNHEPHRDESDPGNPHSHPNVTTGADSDGANCPAQKPKHDRSFRRIEETIMDSYLGCKEVGLSLCVSKDRPKKKLRTEILTLGIMNEVAIFAQKLCGVSMNKIINEVLEHNFDFGFQKRIINPAQQFCETMTGGNRGLAWLSEAFVVKPRSHRGLVKESKRKGATARKKTEPARKREPAPPAEKKSENMCVAETRECVQEEGPQYPFCWEIGLDLDVALKSENKEKLDLKLLTRAVMYDIYTFAVKKNGKNLQCDVFDILDHNFDVSSQHSRRWDFSVAVTAKVQSMIRHYRRTPHRMHEVFELPFVFNSEVSQKSVVRGGRSESADAIVGGLHGKVGELGRFVRQMRFHPGHGRICFLDNFKIDQPWFNEGMDSLAGPEDFMHMNGSSPRAGSDDRIQGNAQSEAGEHDNGRIKLEPDAAGNHPDELTGDLGYTLTTCPTSISNIKSESDPECVQYYILAEPPGPEGYTMLAVCPNAEGSYRTESEAEDVEYIVTVEGSQGYSVLTVDQDSLTKEEQHSYIQMT